MLSYFAHSEIQFILYGAGILFLLGAVLSLLAGTRKENDKVKQLEAALPGAQCAQCGYPGCRAYAEAMAEGIAPCNKCPPGGTDTVEALAEILEISVPQDESDDAIFNPETTEFIHESLCTGCGKCMRKCPVDAIEKTVIGTCRVTDQYCIDCGECIAVCPENCIERIRAEPTLKNYNWELQGIRFKRND